MLSRPRSRVAGGLRIATRDDFADILVALPAFWGRRDVRHLHHPMAIEQFGDGALVVGDGDGRVAASLFGMIIDHARVGYVHVVAVRDDHRGRGLARALHAAFAELSAQRGCTTLKAITTPANAASIAFHESIGMRAREIPDHSGPGRPRVVLVRELIAPAPPPALG